MPLKVPKPVSGEVLSEEDKEIISKEGRDISPEERAALIVKARSLGFGERAVVVRSFASQDWIKQQVGNWGFVTGFSYTTRDKIIEVQWAASAMKGTYQIDELEVIHKLMEFQECKDKLNSYRENKKAIEGEKPPKPTFVASPHLYDLYAGFEE